VFVIDNDSDEDVNQIKSLFPEVVLTINSKNLGFSAAVNIGLKNSISPYIVLLNPDTIVREGFFKSTLRYMEKNSSVGVIGPKIIDHDGSVQGSARSFPTPLTGLFGRSSFLTKLFPNNRFTRSNIITSLSDGKTPMEADWVSGACMVVRREAVNDAGLMDEQFFMYWEDAAWCRNIRQKGWKVVYFPQASIVHFVGISSQKRPIRSLYEFHKSCFILFSKYAKWPLSIIKPIAPLVLAIRFLFISFLQLLHISTQKISEDKHHKDKIKVLRIISRMNIGGPAIHVHLLNKGLNTNKFESLLVTGQISPQEGDMSYLFEPSDKQPILIPELQREISLRKDLKAFIRILKILLKEKPDIVHTHTAKAGSIARITVVLYNLFNKEKVRMIHTFHGHVFKGYFNRLQSILFVWVERFLAKATDVIISISKTQKRELLEKYNIANKEKIKTIPLGFDFDPFHENNIYKGQFRRSLGIYDDTILVGIIGRLVPIKNHIMFFDSIKMFLEHYQEVNVKFIVIGDGELRNKLEVYCKEIGISNYVRFCGWIRDVPSVYADLDILVLTSINEGTPVSIIEAMASYVPVISTDAGGVQDLLGSQDSIGSTNCFKVCERGILCRINDTFGFAKGLMYLIQVDPNEKKKHLDNARNYVINRYSKERLLIDIEGLYKELV